MCAYNVIIGDTLPQVLRSMFPSLSPKNNPPYILLLLTSRRSLIAIVTVGVTFPICLYRDISKLAKVSLLALMALCVIVASVVIQAPLTSESFHGNPDLKWSIISPEVFQVCAAKLII